MHGMGIIWVGKLNPPRWLTVRETSSAMGYVIDPEVAAETGSENIFTRGTQGLSTGPVTAWRPRSGTPCM